MSTHNICFYEEISKIIFELSSNTHLISSAGDGFCYLSFQYTCIKTRETDSYKPYGFFLNLVTNHCYVLYMYVYILMFINLNKYV